MIARWLCRLAVRLTTKRPYIHWTYPYSSVDTIEATYGDRYYVIKDDEVLLRLYLYEPHLGSVHLGSWEVGMLSSVEAYVQAREWKLLLEARCGGS